MKTFSTTVKSRKRSNHNSYFLIAQFKKSFFVLSIQLIVWFKIISSDFSIWFKSVILLKLRCISNFFDFGRYVFAHISCTTNRIEHKLSGYFKICNLTIVFGFYWAIDFEGHFPGAVHCFCSFRHFRPLMDGRVCDSNNICSKFQNDSLYLTIILNLISGTT